MNGCLPLFKKCGFNYDGTAIDYLHACIDNSDMVEQAITPREHKLCNEWNKIEDQLRVGLSKEQDSLLTELSNMSGSYLALGCDQGFAKGFKLGLKLGAEVFTDEDSKDYRDILEDD
jgi:hypothetical protein